MLRTLIIALAIGAPGVAAAQQFPESAVGIDVVGDDGTVIGRVDAAERDADGRVAAVEIEGQEPASAPYTSRDLVAERDDDGPVVRVNARENDDVRSSVFGTRIR